MEREWPRPNSIPNNQRPSTLVYTTRHSRVPSRNHAPLWSTPVPQWGGFRPGVCEVPRVCAWGGGCASVVWSIGAVARGQYMRAKPKSQWAQKPIPTVGIPAHLTHRGAPDRTSLRAPHTAPSLPPAPRNQRDVHPSRFKVWGVGWWWCVARAGRSRLGRPWAGWAMGLEIAFFRRNCDCNSHVTRAFAKV